MIGNSHLIRLGESSKERLMGSRVCIYDKRPEVIFAQCNGRETLENNHGFISKLIEEGRYRVKSG